MTILASSEVALVPRSQAFLRCLGGKAQPSLGHLLQNLLVLGVFDSPSQAIAFFSEFAVVPYRFHG